MLTRKSSQKQTKSQSRGRHRRSLRLEMLQQRQLMAGDVDVMAAVIPGPSGYEWQESVDFDSFAEVSASTIDRQGRVVVVGNAKPDSTGRARGFGIARFHSDGTSDTSLGRDSEIQIDMGAPVKVKDVAENHQRWPDGCRSRRFGCGH